MAATAQEWTGGVAYTEFGDYDGRTADELAEYGWVDQDKGVVRIPIERAMDEMVGALAAFLSLVPQGESLVDAEAVLLVDDGDGEVLEDDVRLE